MPFGAPITSKSNARVKALRASFSGKASKPGELVGIEGEHLIAEALRSGLEFETVFVHEGREQVLDRPLLASLNRETIVVLKADVFASVVSTSSPQAIAAVVVIPEPAPIDLQRYRGTLLVIEALQDPGNLGTILRSAEAFGVQHILATTDTVSAWNPKVIRASAGSVFRVPVTRMSLSSVGEALHEHGYKVLAAVASADAAVALTQCDLSGPCAFLIGNEGAGLSQQARSLASANVTIPCKVESFNAAVAASILMYEAVRQSSEDLR
jgi:TrmH family RNA methyltransferase